MPGRPGPDLKPAAVFWLLVLILGVAGCAAPEAPEPEPCVLKAGTVCVTKPEFADELDLKLTAYPYDLSDRPGAYNNMVLDLLAVLSDETVLLAAAADNGVTVTAGDVDAAEAVIMKDYPEDSFHQMLLENAVPYRVWKKRLKKDMVIQAFVEGHLVRAQEITPEDMVAFYRQYLGQDGNGARTGSDLDENRLVEMLRMEKSQVSYDQWISSLNRAYPVTIDKTVLAGFLADQEQKRTK